MIIYYYRNGQSVGKFIISNKKIKILNNRILERGKTLGYTTGTKWNYDMVKEYIEKEGYDLNSKEYKNMRTKLDMTCPEGHEVQISFDCFKRMGVRCKICSSKKSAKKRSATIDEVRAIIESEEGYTLLSTEYIPSKKIKIRHNCGHEYEVTLNNFKRGERCPHCRHEEFKEKCKKKRISREYVEKEVEKEGYFVISFGNFEKSRDKLKLKCPKGHEYETTWNTFQRGKRCPYCNNSKGEKRISEYLISNSINYISQYKFENCRNNKPLPFDFYLPDYNICIEYDGEQHFHPVDFGGKGIKKAEEEYLGFKKRDKIKTQYCENNNIKLIRIPYWEFDNIENILIRNLI